MMLKFSFPIFLLLFGIAFSQEKEGDPYYYKPESSSLTAQELLENLLPTVKNLDLSNHPEVDDEFIRALSSDRRSESIVNINLSGTDVSEKALVYILGSKTLGTRRELPQISGQYGMPSAEIYLDISNTKIIDTKNFEKPVSGVEINYQRADGKKVAESAIGIKRLTFNQKSEY